MQKAELKNLVFERFEERRVEIIKKRNRFQQELDQDVQQLREAYGDAAVNGLGDLSLTVASSEPSPTKNGGRRAGPQREQRRQQPKRRRRRRVAGEPTARSLLDEHAPAATTAVAANKDEFQARDVYDHLKNVSGLDIQYGSVSLYLGQNAKKLGLVVEKRKAGDRIPRPTNFFRLSRPRKAKKSKLSPHVGNVNWVGSITAGLKGVREGLTQSQLKDRLVKQGIPQAKFNGAGFHGALARLLGEGKITLKDDRYRS